MGRGGEGRKLISIRNFVSEIQEATERRGVGLCYRVDNLSGTGTVNYCQCTRGLQKWRVLVVGIASRI
jgi:hypothetical protein